MRNCHMPARLIMCLYAIRVLSGESDGHSTPVLTTRVSRASTFPSTRYWVRRTRASRKTGFLLRERHAPEIEIDGLEPLAIAPGCELLQSPSVRPASVSTMVVRVEKPSCAYEWPLSKTVIPARRPSRVTR